jgi:tetratricopeptide (TPR) repeat protein
MKTFKKNIFIILIPLLFSCEDYLNVVPTGVIIPKTVDDYKDILNSPAVFDKAYPPCDFYIGSDDLRGESSYISLIELRNIFTWQTPPYAPGEEPFIWSTFYKAIYSYNIILNSIDDVSGDKEKIRQIEGEALLGRAFEHLMLLNLFAKPYNVSTANTDPGIPFVISADINTKTPSRLTIEKTYELIVADLTKAIKLLPESQKYNHRGTKTAAYGVLARMYLYKADYDNALQYAIKAMEGNENKLQNYITLFVNSKRGFGSESEEFKRESIYFKSLNSRLDKFLMTKEFLDLLYDGHPSFIDEAKRRAGGGIYDGFTDFRTAIYGSLRGYSGPPPHYDVEIKSRTRIYYGITYPEMLLIKAESMARKNNLQGALDAINLLRRNRIRDVVDLSSSDNEEVLQWVLDERRREFFLNGLRWFDMRRLSAEGKLGTITRKTFIPGKDGIQTFTLAPNGNNYTFQIPSIVIAKNPGMEQNPY